MNRLNHFAAAAAAATAFFLFTHGTPLRAADLPSTAPATTNMSDEGTAGDNDDEPTITLNATITGIEGHVQVRSAADQPWKSATIGMTLDAGAEFRTGPRSAVRFVIPPDQVITLDRLGTVKVMQAIRDASSVKTELGMKYGRTRYDIEAAGLEHDSSIHSPTATLSIRGTRVSLYDQPPFVAEAVNLRGVASFQVGKGNTYALAHAGNGGTAANSKNPEAAGLALNESLVDPGNSTSRTDSESKLIDQLPSVGTLGLFGGLSGQVHGFDTGPQNTFNVQRHLEFTVSWIGNADVDMFVISPLKEQLATYPPGGIPVAGGTGPIASSTPSGGIIAFDFTAPNGHETADWANHAPAGTYVVGGRIYSGGPASVTIEGTLNGKPLSPAVTNSLTSTGDFTSTTFNVPAAKRSKNN